MATITRRLTYDDLPAIPQERVGDQHEIIDGELVVTTSPTPAHQIISENIGNFLGNHARANALGKVLYAPVDIRLTPEIVLIPDIIFIAKDRLDVIGPKAIDAAPDLVVEILSPVTRQRDLRIKRDLYARYGVQEYWIVDPNSRSLMILALHEDQFEPVALSEDRRLVSHLFPGLEVDHDAIFGSP